jgi:hypothetical protein
MACAAVAVGSVVLTAPDRDLEHDLPAFVISFIAADLYLLVSVALWFARHSAPAFLPCLSDPL